jgi:membrane associated rhomboid family serine protease
MLFLAIFGKNVEDAFGPLLHLVFYFAAMMTQTAMTLLFGTAQDARVPELGASGAIGGFTFGLLVARLLADGGKSHRRSIALHRVTPAGSSLARRQKPPDTKMHTEFASGIVSLVM